MQSISKRVLGVHKKTPNSDQGRAYFGPQMIDDWRTLVLKKQSNYPVEMSKKKKKKNTYLTIFFSLQHVPL